MPNQPIMMFSAYTLGRRSPAVTESRTPVPSRPTGSTCRVTESRHTESNCCDTPTGPETPFPPRARCAACPPGRRLSRRRAVETILRSLGKDAVVVSASEAVSREVRDGRKKLNVSGAGDFLVDGLPGKAVLTALDMAQKTTHRHESDVYVVCLDDDGTAMANVDVQRLVAGAHCPTLLYVLLNDRVETDAARRAAGVADDGEPGMCRSLVTKAAEAFGYYVAGSYAGGSEKALYELLFERIEQMIYSWACDPDEDWQTTFLEVKVASA